MILLTDRHAEGGHLIDMLGIAKECAMLTLEQGRSLEACPDVLICDIDLTADAVSDRLHQVLAHFRSMGTCKSLFLCRDPSLLTRSRIASFGPSAVVLGSAPAADINEALAGLRPANAALAVTQPPKSKRSPIETSVFAARDALAELFVKASQDQTISKAVIERGGEIVRDAVSQSSIQSWLDVVRRCDNVTYQHCLLVAGLTAAMAMSIGLSLAHQRLLSQAALIHDIGKARVPSAILNKPGPLTPAEMATMRTHAPVGHEMLVRQRQFDPQLLDMVRHHHEYLDGTGYPDGLRSTQISQFVRLLTICDIYAALIERRPYKAPAPSEKALSILSEMGDKLDRGLLSNFAAVITSTAVVPPASRATRLMSA